MAVCPQFGSAVPPSSPSKKAKSPYKAADSVASYIERGRRYSRLSQFQKAVETFSVAIRKFPQASEIYLLRAQAYSDLGQLQKQINDLTSAIKIRPQSADLYEKRADVNYKLRRLRSAIDDATAAMRLDPTSPNGYRIAAAAYEELELHDKAIDTQTKLLELKASGALDWNNRAKNYQRIGKLLQARADRQKATELANSSERGTMQLCSPLLDFAKFGDDSRDIVDSQLKGNPVVLPFQYDPGGKICVPVQVNGKPLLLMLDTGWGHSDLWKKAMPKVIGADNFQSDQTKQVKGYKSGVFKVRELKLGNLTLANVSMAVDEGLADHKTLSGFLGGNILENFVVTIDYSKKQLLLAAPSSGQPPTKGISVPMRIRHHHPYCSVALNGQLDFEALVDTGSPTNFSADALLKPILPQQVAWSEIQIGPSIGLVSVGAVQLKSLEVGSLSIENPIFSVFPAEGAPHAAAEIILGNEFLSRFKTVTFDYPGRRLLLEPHESASPSALTLITDGKFYSSHGQQRRALDSFGRAMDLDGDFAESCLWYRARIFEHLKEYEHAIKELDALIKLDANHIDAYQHRASNYRQLGEYARQIADDTALIRLLQYAESNNQSKSPWGPSIDSAYLDRAWAYDKLGKHRLADRDRRAAELHIKLRR